jgi:hypothetical protein
MTKGLLAGLAMMLLLPSVSFAHHWDRGHSWRYRYPHRHYYAYPRAYYRHNYYWYPYVYYPYGYRPYWYW